MDSQVFSDSLETVLYTEDHGNSVWVLGEDQQVLAELKRLSTVPCHSLEESKLYQISQGQWTNASTAHLLVQPSCAIIPVWHWHIFWTWVVSARNKDWALLHSCEFMGSNHRSCWKAALQTRTWEHGAPPLLSTGKAASGDVSSAGLPNGRETGTYWRESS